MAALAIISLIIIGLILLLLEIFVLPGFIVGIIGAGLIIGGVVMTFNQYGNTIGILSIFTSIVLFIASFALGLKSKTWKKLMLNTQIDGKAGENPKEQHIKIGDKGITISRLAPMGKVMLNDEFFEAKSSNLFIDQNTEIEVINVIHNQIIVKPLNV